MITTALGLVYPTLVDVDGNTLQPDIQGYAEGVTNDPTVKTPKEDGPTQRRKRYSAVPMVTRKFTYRDLSDANKVTLKAFERDDAEYENQAFWFYDWVAQDMYQVCLAEAIKFAHEKTNQHLWKASVHVEQVVSGLIAYNTFGWGVFGDGLFPG